jgi:glycosyltransferase involved in cell wall biosynthesis
MTELSTTGVTHNSSRPWSFLLWADWATRPQRHHHFAREILRLGHSLTVAAMVSSRHALKRPRRSLSAQVNAWHFPEQLHGAALRLKYYLPFHRFGFMRRLDDYRQARFLNRVFAGGPFDIGIMNHPTRTPISKGRVNFLIYDVMDDLPALLHLGGARPEEIADFVRREEHLAQAADLIFTVSPPIFARFRARFPHKTFLAPNGVEFDRFAQDHGSDPPPLPFPAGPPLIVFAGALGEWFDWDTLFYCCQALPDCNFLVMGGFSAKIHRLVKERRHPNLELLGQVPYPRLPAIFRQAHTGIIPRVKHPATEAMSPLKLYEYLAAGLPVVSSPMHDCENLAAPGLVYVADSPAAFAASLKEAVHLSRRPDLVRQRRSIARQHSWDRRWLRCEELIAAHFKAC